MWKGQIIPLSSNNELLDISPDGTHVYVQEETPTQKMVRNLRLLDYKQLLSTDDDSECSSDSGTNIVDIQSQVQRSLDAALHEAWCLKELLQMMLEQPQKINEDPIHFQKKIHAIQFPKPPKPVEIQVEDLSYAFGAKKAFLRSSAEMFRKAADELSRTIETESLFFSQYAIPLRDSNWQMRQLRSSCMLPKPNLPLSLYIEYFPNHFAEIIRCPSLLEPAKNRIDIQNFQVLFPDEKAFQCLRIQVFYQESISEFHCQAPRTLMEILFQAQATAFHEQKFKQLVLEASLMTNVCVDDDEIVVPLLNGHLMIKLLQFDLVDIQSNVFFPSSLNAKENLLCVEHSLEDFKNILVFDQFKKQVNDVVVEFCTQNQIDFKDLVLKTKKSQIELLLKPPNIMELSFNGRITKIVDYKHISNLLCLIKEELL